MIRLTPDVQLIRHALSAVPARRSRGQTQAGALRDFENGRIPKWVR
jgi:hypothetical protein